MRELLDLCGLGRAFELLTLSKQYGGAGVNNVMDMRKLFMVEDNNVWSFKLQLSAAEEGGLRTTMSAWHALSCMPLWMRHADLALGLAMASALDNQTLAKHGELLLNMVSAGARRRRRRVAVAAHACMQVHVHVACSF